MGQCKSEYQGFKSYANAVFTRCCVVYKSEHRDFKKAKERTRDSESLMGQCKSVGKDFQRD
jgi:hypothetical protein